MSKKEKKETVQSKLKTVVFLTLWCYLNIFLFIDLLSFSIKDLHPIIVFASFLFVTGFIFVPFIVGTLAYVELGTMLADQNNLRATFRRVMPLVLSYFLVIYAIWLPVDGKLISAIFFELKNPNWFQLTVWAIIIYFVVQSVVEKPFNKIPTALISILAVQHLLKLYFFYRLDDGCSTDFDGYVDCDDSYVQSADRAAETAESTGLSVSSLFAADLYVISIYCIILFVLGAFFKNEVENWRWRRRPFSERAQEIINVYGIHMQKHPVTTEIYDEKILPYSKETILDAICYGIENTDSDEFLEILKASAISLSNYQKDVGDTPIMQTNLDFFKEDISSLDTDTLLNKYNESMEKADPELHKKLWPTVEREAEEILKLTSAAVAKRNKTDN